MWIKPEMLASLVKLRARIHRGSLVMQAGQEHARYALDNTCHMQLSVGLIGTTITTNTVIEGLLEQQMYMVLYSSISTGRHDDNVCTSARASSGWGFTPQGRVSHQGDRGSSTSDLCWRNLVLTE